MCPQGWECVPEGTVRTRGEVVSVCTRLSSVCTVGVCVREDVWCVCRCQSSVRGVAGIEMRSFVAISRLTPPGQTE